LAGAGASHEPPGYDCPFCRVARGEETDYNRHDDVVWRDPETVAFVSPRWWPANAGHVIVIPCAHVENLYAVDDELLGAVQATVKRVAIAMRTAYGCAGTSTRQHNEPAAGQDVWHYHVHVFPREQGDGLYARDAEYRWATADERAPYAARLRAEVSRRFPHLRGQTRV
jgi:histidine triad (HIT) family protein